MQGKTQLAKTDGVQSLPFTVNRVFVKLAMVTVATQKFSLYYKFALRYSVFGCYQPVFYEYPVDREW